MEQAKNNGRKTGCRASLATEAFDRDKVTESNKKSESLTYQAESCGSLDVGCGL